MKRKYTVRIHREVYYDLTVWAENASDAEEFAYEDYDPDNLPDGEKWVETEWVDVADSDQPQAEV